MRKWDIPLEACDWPIQNATLDAIIDTFLACHKLLYIFPLLWQILQESIILPVAKQHVMKTDRITHLEEAYMDIPQVVQQVCIHSSVRAYKGMVQQQVVEDRKSLVLACNLLEQVGHSPQQNMQTHSQRSGQVFPWKLNRIYQLARFRQNIFTAF